MMRRIVTALGLCVGLVISGCTVQIRNVDKTTQRTDIPDVGVSQTVELGSSMVTQRTASVVRGKKLPQVTRGTLGIFPADYEGMFVRANDGEHFCGFVTLRDPLNNGKRNFICFTAAEMAEKKDLPFADVEEVVAEPTNLQRVLEYSGRTGQSISIFYKEFNETHNGAFIRPAFTQEFKFDLSEGNVIGIKGARIEVIQATNTGITYKVLSHFPRQP